MKTQNLALALNQTSHAEVAQASRTRVRKSPFVRLFDKTPPGVICPHFYELVLSNGCPYRCVYCYLQLTFRGDKAPVLFNNPWEQVEREIERIERGVFSTGELADSLAIIPPLLSPAIEYFRRQHTRYLLLVTKSSNVDFLLKIPPSRQVWVSFSVNSEKAWKQFEPGTPHPYDRIEAAWKLKEKGWSVRIRLDPVILEVGLENYRRVVREIAELRPDCVTVGTLRHYPGLFRFQPQAPRKGLHRAADGRMRYSLQDRLRTYGQIADWLGFQPALCKETVQMWHSLKWKFYGCNCTPIAARQQSKGLTNDHATQ